MSKFWFLCTILYFTMYMYVWSSMCNITMYSNDPFHCPSTSQTFCQERGVHIFGIKKSILMMKICLESCSQLWLVEVFHIILYMYSFSYCLLMTDKRQRSKCKTRFCLNPRAVSFACTIIHSKTWKWTRTRKSTNKSTSGTPWPLYLHLLCNNLCHQLIFLKPAAESSDTPQCIRLQFSAPAFNCDLCKVTLCPTCTVYMVLGYTCIIFNCVHVYKYVYSQIMCVGPGQLIQFTFLTYFASLEHQIITSYL